MTRVAVLATSLVFILGFAFLTIRVFATEGVTPGGVIAVFVLVLLTVGVVGALRNPPQ